MIYRLSNFHFPHKFSAPLIVEIGFGDGRFWPAYAASQPVSSYLGAELSGVSLLKAQARLQSAQLDNGILTKLPANVLLQQIVAPSSISQLIINFPDPWPKAGHLEHRLLRTPFWQLAASRLSPNGVILLTTDHDEYFQFALEQAQQTQLLNIDSGTAPPDAALETKYARKWRELGLKVNHARLSLHPNAQSPSLPATFSRYEETEVPHAILFNLPSQTEFSKHAINTPTHTVVLLDMYSRQRGGVVFLAHIVEGELTQEVLIETTPRQDGSYLVRLSKFGGPVITAGVKAAVQVVANWWIERGASRN